MSTENKPPTGFIRGPVSVKESLPDIGVLGLAFRGRRTGFNAFLNEQGHWTQLMDAGFTIPAVGVSHWMPAPLPEEEN